MRIFSFPITVFFPDPFRHLRKERTSGKLQAAKTLLSCGAGALARGFCAVPAGLYLLLHHPALPCRAFTFRPFGAVLHNQTIPVRRTTNDVRRFSPTALSPR